MPQETRNCYGIRSYHLAYVKLEVESTTDNRESIDGKHEIAYLASDRLASCHHISKEHLSNLQKSKTV